jgi:hypothetical protein
MFLKNCLLSLLLGVLTISNLCAQNRKVNPDQIQAVTIQDDTSVVRMHAFLEESDIKHSFNLHYYTYYRERIIVTQGSHLGRLLHGKFQRFSKDMVLLEEGEFEYGLQVEQWKHWREGQLYQIAEYKEGQLHGDFEQYDNEGNLHVKSAYKKGELHGETEIYEQGTLSGTEKYRNGELVPVKEKETSTDSTAVADSQATTKEQPSSDVRKSSGSTRDAQVPNRTRTRRGNSNTVQPSTPAKSSAEDGSSSAISAPQEHKVQIFVTDQQSGQGLKQVSIKISQFQLAAEDPRFKFFGYTDEDGYYQLNVEEQNYVLFITQKGYRPHQLRINAAQAQDTYLVALIPKPDCGELSGTVQPAAKNTAIAGAAVHLKDQRGRLLKTTYSDNRGNFSVCLPCNEAYDIIVESEGYQRLQERVFLSANCIDLPQDVVLYLPSDRPRAQPQYTPARPDTRIAEAESDNRPATTTSNQQRNTAASPFRTVGNEAAFFVIAGTFSRRGNAESRLAEVKAAGFDDAQIVKLSDSGYFAVCLGNLDSRGAAAALRQRFESVTQINAYVRDEPF